MSRAICLRCGGDKRAYDQICPACGQVPDGEGLLVAWLLSDANLSPSQLDETAARVRRGQSVRPSDRMIDRARVALGRHASADPGLTHAQRLALLATSLLLTPAPGLLLWAWWRDDRPRAAFQALWLSLPAGVVFLGVLSWAWLRTRFG